MLDGEKRPAVGTRLMFLGGITRLGQAIIGRDGAILSVPDSFGAIEVRAEFMGQRKVARVEPDEQRHEFKFSAFGRNEPPGPRTAYCADGTSGQPCVDCLVAGKSVRICV